VTPYERLLGLARRERELVAAHAWEALHEIEAERAALLETLPPDPPRAVHALLAETATLVRASETALAAAVEATRGELGRVGHGRRALSGYGGTRTGTFDELG